MKYWTQSSNDRERLSVEFEVDELHERLPASWRLLHGSDFQQEYGEPPPGGDPLAQAMTVLHASLILQAWIREWSGECFGCRLVPVHVEADGQLLGHGDLVVFSDLFAEFAVLLVRESGDAGRLHAWCVGFHDTDRARSISEAEVECESRLLDAVQRARDLAVSSAFGGER